MRRAAPIPSTTETQYALVRAVTVVFLVGLYFLGVAGPERQLRDILYIGALSVLVLDSVALFVLRRRGVEYGRALLYILPPDLVATALLVWLLKDFDDAFFPVCVFLPVTYALVLQKRDTWLIGGATALAYIAGHALHPAADATQWILFVLKSLAIPFIAAMVAETVDQQRQRQAEAVAAAEERERINHRLHQRMAELQAVSQITDVIHSSLEFDRVGPVVLDILAKAISVSACCLFVIDKEKSETLFSASVGRIAGVVPQLDDAEYQDDHFSCLPVLDHLQMMVLFCASADDIARLSSEDRLVLSAVASELVVAVENSRLYKLTKKLSITDELTSLYNYRYLQQRLDEEIERSKRYEKQLSLLMIDVDDFKKYNDTHGHIAGDLALHDLGKVMRSCVREVDVVARYGGEEFSVVLPETDAAGAYVVAEKLREAISKHLFADADGARLHNMSVSIGLSSYPSHAKDKEALLREADDALYHAKHGGKNRVRTPQLHKPVEGPGAATREGDTTDDEWTES